MISFCGCLFQFLLQFITLRPWIIYLSEYSREEVHSEDNGAAMMVLVETFALSIIVELISRVSKETKSLNCRPHAAIERLRASISLDSERKLTHDLKQ